MRLPSIASLAVVALSTAVEADYVATVANLFGWRGIFVTGFGTHWVDASPGCRDPDIPSMNNICFDYDNGRGHFYFDNQPKRCFKKFGSQANVEQCAFAGKSDCYVTLFFESACTW
jgi:hypothetical protein